MADINEENMSAANATVALTLKSWDRFQTPNLRVDPSLLGAAHSFTHQGKSIKIALPTASEATNADRVKLDHWLEHDPADYLIHSVDVSVSLPGAQTFPSAVLERPPNARDIIALDEQLRLELLSKCAGQIALEAFDSWIRCVRWKTGLGQFGRAAVVGPEAGWTTRLRDASSGKTVWSGKGTFTSPARPSITSHQWEHIGSALGAGKSPPLFVDLLFDAEMHIEAGDFRRAVIDVAVAAETYIRTTVESTLPAELGEAARRFIDDGNIRPVVERLLPEALVSLGKSGYKVPADLHKLFDSRNKIMHSGHISDLTMEKCNRYVALVRALVADHLQ